MWNRFHAWKSGSTPPAKGTRSGALTVRGLRRSATQRVPTTAKPAPRSTTRADPRDAMSGCVIPRVLVELLFAVVRAEVVGLTLIDARPHRVALLNGHSTNRVFHCHPFLLCVPARHSAAVIDSRWAFPPCGWSPVPSFP